MLGHHKIAPKPPTQKAPNLDTNHLSFFFFSYKESGLKSPLIFFFLSPQLVVVLYYVLSLPHSSNLNRAHLT
jgi:hypothetical protein